MAEDPYTIDVCTICFFIQFRSTINVIHYHSVIGLKIFTTTFGPDRFGRVAANIFSIASKDDAYQLDATIVVIVVDCPVLDKVSGQLHGIAAENRELIVRARGIGATIISHLMRKGQWAYDIKLW